MEPIEVNAGRVYLRSLRADDRVDDRPALAEGGITDPDYVATRIRDWAADAAYTWAVCDITTGELRAELVLDPSTGRLTGWARAGERGLLDEGIAAVHRFAEGALGLAVTDAVSPGTAPAAPR
ncbi:hypothetical protein G4H71_17595 [Rhodococcus triatomae]|uniref:Uncharacterized protein n=1 Tax=Rhodococcus triatomae TaxID=300028 RepID=A0A1G8FF97_9NOCA|nr:hypothetical protein [Rhodococcus triatomae]QNG19469.1 hypothetical protein G4H72_12780 [Rhodococcus triatomae]QNG24616.1 hypothetical protein G4H71_17595 [Rhodococcus triatomae]SDH80824.1 hypothetical protein SAMN05444695_103268 [Rhodococcus triatomae]